MEVQKYPEVRFEQFNDNWHGLKLADFGESFSGTAIESEFVKKGKYKVISIGSYSLDSTYTDQALRVNYTEKTKDRILGLNDLAMVLNDKTLSGEIIGRTLLIEEDDAYVFNQRTQRIILNQKLLDPFFIYQLLNANFIRSKVIKLAQGNTQIYVNWSTIKNIEHLIPSKEEQKHISQFFRKLDQSIALHEKKLAQTENLKKAMLEKMFPKQGSQRPEIRLKGFSGDWSKFKLKDFGEASSGTALETEFDKKGKYKVISIGSYSLNSIYVDQGLRANKTEKTKDRILEKNDLTMVLNDKTLSGEIIGRVLLIDEDDKYVFNQRTQRIVVNKDVFHPYFLYYLLNADQIRKKVIALSQGNTQIYVNWSAIQVLEYFVPSKDEQIRIANFFKQLGDAINLQKQQLQTLKNLKQAFLEKMFV